MTEEKTFSLDYVQELRQENASWRTKNRDLEASKSELESKLSKNTVQSQVANEFVKRGIKADPSWLKVPEGSDVAVAVDGFVAEYPQFADTGKTSTETKDPTKPTIPATNKQSQKTNNTGSLDRSIIEQRDDPKARSEIRDHYRSLLSGDKR